MKQLDPKVIGLAALTTLASCDKDKDLPPTPKPTTPIEKATTNTRTKVEKQTLVINNTNNGDSTNITVTDKAGNIELDTTFTAKQFMHRLNNLPADDYTTKTTTKTTTKKAKTADATDTDKNTIEKADETPATFNYTAEAQDLDNTGHANDIVVVVNNATHPSGIKSITVKIDGNTIAETNGKYTKKDATVGTHNIEIIVINNNDISETKTKTVEITPPPTPESVDLPDLTYTRSLDNATVTEDVSYTSVGNNTGHAVVATKTVNGVVTEYILTLNNNNAEYTTTKASLVEAINNASLGSALQLNMAETYESGYGLNGFTRVDGITFENGQDTGTTVINQHGETVSIDGYVKGIQYVRETLGVSMEAFLNAPNQAFNTGNDTKLNWQICRAFAIEFGKKMQQTGATDKTTVQNWAAEAYTRVKNMTPEQRRAAMVEMFSENTIASVWD